VTHLWRRPAPCEYRIMESFLRLGLTEPLAAALASFGFAAPTPVQAEAIPLLLDKHDLMMESVTGAGKTFAYLAPALQVTASRTAPGPRRSDRGPSILVAAPTQELAVQIGREAERLTVAAGYGARTLVLLGGTPMEKQSGRLKERPDIVVGTLGRLADLASLRRLDLSHLRYIVLDEADRLFEPETRANAEALLRAAPQSCCRVAVSATLPERLRRMLRLLLKEAAEIGTAETGPLPASIEHWCFYCDGRKRLDFLRRFEASQKPARCLVFLSLASRVASVAQRLAAFGLPIAAMHAGMEKEERRVALERFTRGEIRYLLTSDLGARGLDIPDISHVLSLDLPEEPTVYTHRAGRTGRAGAPGISVVLADGIELSRASRIAVRGRFVFRCKSLARGMVLEPAPADFFAKAEEAEEERTAAKAARIVDGPRRGGRPARPIRPDRRGPEGRAHPGTTSSEGPGPVARRGGDKTSRSGGAAERVRRPPGRRDSKRRSP
jgi:ATP-dependent RNA helicase DeaD